MSVIGPNIAEDLSRALAKFLDQSDQEGMREVYQFLSAFKEENEILFITYLSQVLGNEEEVNSSRVLAALFIFRTMKKRTLEDQRIFMSVWQKQEFDLHESLRAAAFNGIMSEEYSLNNNCSSLLGLIFAVELAAPGPKEQFLKHFIERMYELFEIATSSEYFLARRAVYTSLEYFAQYSLEFNPHCAHDQAFMRDIVPHLFDCIIAGMVNSELPPVQEKASLAMLQSLLVFKRHLSFTQNRQQLMEILFLYLTSDDDICEAPKQQYFSIGYVIIRKIIDLFYPYTEEFIEPLFEQTEQDLQSGNPDREIEASLLWLTIGEVESDIKFPERKIYKNRHHEFDQSLGLSSTAFPRIFPALVQIIASTPEDETEASVALDRNPQHAAFSCLSELSIAADQTALEPIFEFVKANIANQDWTLRYTSSLLLNAASQLSSFEADIDNILTTFGLFVQCLEDVIPRIIEVAMWSLGRMIERIPELIIEPERFQVLTTAITTKMNISSQLTSRACWLYNRIFNVFSPGEEDSLIAINFTEFSSLLLEAADVWQDEVDPLDAAYGALNRLIERTPSTLVEPYAAFLEKVVQKLNILIQNPEKLKHPHSLHKALGLCSFIQAIVMNIGPVIAPSADTLIQLLLHALGTTEGDLICEVLPALGAIARAIGTGFLPYLEGLIPQIQEYLTVQETVQYAAVFVSDIYSAINQFPAEITGRFVELLFQSFSIDDLSNEGRVASFSALTEIAKQIGLECMPWVEQFLELFEKESRSSLSTENEYNDDVYIKSFTLAILQCYQTIVPIFASVERGDRKVRNFFHIYDKLVRMNDIIDEEVIMEAVMLVKLIAETFGRKMNVYTNKPVVKKILQRAQDSENPTLEEAAKAAIESIQSC
jgi:importin subunit beta-1